MAQEGGQAHPRRGEPLYGHKGGLGFSQPFGEVRGCRDRGGKPVPKPADLIFRVEYGPIKMDRGAGQGTSVSFGPPVDKFSLRDGETDTQNEIGGLFFFFFFSFFFYIIYSLLRYKKSHGALAMAKTKPKTQNELTKEISGTYLFNWGPYRSQAHIRARNYTKYSKENPSLTSGRHEKQKCKPSFLEKT